MEQDSKALTAFTVGSLGFFEGKRIPFGLKKCSCYVSMFNTK